MKIYNGLSLERRGKSWEALVAMYPSKKGPEIEALLIKRLELFAEKLGQKFDEEIYMANLKEVAIYLDVKYAFLLLNVCRRWSKSLEAKLEHLVVLGSGECSNCGVDGLEFHDHGSFWKTPDIYKCTFCGSLQHRGGD